MTKKLRTSTSQTAPVQRPATHTEFAARSAAGDFDTTRTSIVFSGSPSRPYSGDKVFGVFPLIVESEYILALPSEESSVKSGFSTRIGTAGFFASFGPIGSNPGYPPAWLDADGAPQPSWEFGGGSNPGSFRMGAAGAPATGKVQIQGSVSVKVAAVDFRFVLKNEDANGNPTGVISSTPRVELTAVGSPQPYDWTMRIDDDGATPPTPVVYDGRIFFTPGQWMGLYLERFDGGPDRDVTWDHLQVTPATTHWLP